MRTNRDGLSFSHHFTGFCHAVSPYLLFLSFKNLVAQSQAPFNYVLVILEKKKPDFSTRVESWKGVRTDNRYQGQVTGK